MNKLILGDNLDILRQMDSESVDLIYLDPPFFSNRNYEVIWGDKGEIRSFEDRWSGGIDHYIAWLKERVVEMHRILKSTGSIFLHCDWHADVYIRVYILDKLFGEKNFINEIIWGYNTGGVSKKWFGRKHDLIWFYAKDSKKNKLNLPTEKNYIPTLKGRTFAVEKLQAKIEEEGCRVCGQKGGWYHLGAMRDVWTDINALFRNNQERIGYPTQKPEKLLERIILAASNEGDRVLDPFVGGGTTVAVAERLKRHFLGIDQSVQAIKVTEMRLQKPQDLFSKPFTVQLHKYDYDTLRYKDAFEFEQWIIQQYGGLPNIQQRGDKGIDGKTSDGVPIQVKRSDNTGRNVVDNFRAACGRFDKALFEKKYQAQGLPVGIIIAFSFGKGAVQEVARLKNEEDIIIELVTVDTIVPIAKKPKLTLQYEQLGTDKKGLREIAFTASGDSEVGIEFYAWNWDFDEAKGFQADVLIDKIGKQQPKFKAGNYRVAVKIVDNEGLEAMEIIDLKVNE